MFPIRAAVTFENKRNYFCFDMKNAVVEIMANGLLGKVSDVDAEHILKESDFFVRNILYLWPVVQNIINY